jgi:hypothetical protein
MGWWWWRNEGECSTWNIGSGVFGGKGEPGGSPVVFGRDFVRGRCQIGRKRARMPRVRSLAVFDGDVCRKVSWRQAVRALSAEVVLVLGPSAESVLRLAGFWTIGRRWVRGVASVR